VIARRSDRVPNNGDIKDHYDLLNDRGRLRVDSTQVSRESVGCEERYSLHRDDHA
jgi:hypothetical protein